MGFAVRRRSGFVSLLALSALACTSTPDAAAPSDAGAAPAPTADAGPELGPCAASDRDGDGYGTDPSCPVLDCDDTSFGVHPGATEACNGLDEDCDDEIDEGLGDSWCGEGACRQRLPNCVAGRPSRCVAEANGTPESCNGIDDDCNGAVDDGLLGETCGVGACERRAECAGGGWQACTPGAPEAEVCNGVDDDCNGAVDDGFEVVVQEGAYTALAGRHPICDGDTERMGANCNAAIHRHCAASACHTSGFGPLENSGDTAFLACVSAEVSEVPFATLAGQHPGCNGANPAPSPDCHAAIHRWCRARGHASGFGPVEQGTGTAAVACLSSAVAQVVSTTYTTLAGHHPGCTAQSRWGPDCNAAMNRFCRARGFRTGYGPAENAGDAAAVICVRTP